MSRTRKLKASSLTDMVAALANQSAEPMAVAEPAGVPVVVTEAAETAIPMASEDLPHPDLIEKNNVDVPSHDNAKMEKKARRRGRVKGEARDDAEKIEVVPEPVQDQKWERLKPLPRDNAKQIEPSEFRPIVPRKPRPRLDEDGMRTRVRRERPHSSFYAHPKVMRAIREIAMVDDIRAHDVVIEGLRMVLARYGYDFDSLNRGE